MNINYTVRVSGTYYSRDFIYGYADYGDALDMFKERAISAAEMLSICQGDAVTICLLDANGKTKRQLTFNSSENKEAVEQTKYTLIIPEFLPSGAEIRQSAASNDHFVLSSKTISRKDIDRMYGIIHPAKVHGKWKGYCGDGPEDSKSSFEQAINETAENNKNYSPDTL